MKKRTKHIYEVERRPLDKDEAFAFVIATTLTMAQLFNLIMLILATINVMRGDHSNESIAPFVTSLFSTLMIWLGGTAIWRTISLENEGFIIYLVMRIKSIFGLPEVVYGGDELMDDILNPQKRDADEADE